MRATVWVAASLIMSAARELVHPGRIEDDFGPVAVEDLEDLVAIGRGVARDVLARQRRPRRVLAGRVADHPGEITDQKQDVMAELLKLPELVQQHRVAEVQVGRGRVEAGLDAQRLAALAGARRAPPRPEARRRRA